MRKRLIGTVTSDKNSKTRRVEVQRLFRHPKYGKIVRGRTVCHVHDENNDSHEGDTVEIIECRPHSRMKRWELVRVVSAAADIRAAAAKEKELAASDAEPDAAEGAAT